MIKFFFSSRLLRSVVLFWFLRRQRFSNVLVVFFFSFVYYARVRLETVFVLRGESGLVRCVVVVYLHISASVSADGRCVSHLGAPIPRQNHENAAITFKWAGP